MSNNSFFASKLGLSALVSVAAMVAFNLFAVAQAGTASTSYSNPLGGAPAALVQMAELA